MSTSELSVGNDGTVQCRVVFPDTDNSVVAGSIQLIGMYVCIATYPIIMTI